MSFYKSSTRKSCVARGETVVAMGKAMISALLLFLGFVAQANAVCYVNGAATGKNDGSSWTDAYTNPQFALLNPAVCAEIWVAKGVYKPTLGTDPTVSFVVSAGVTMYGGFLGGESSRDSRLPAVNLTAFSGDIDNNDANFAGSQIDATPTDIFGTNTYHVVYMDGAGGLPIDSSTLLDGFTITGGAAVGPSDETGGGLFCSGSAFRHVDAECSPTLRNMVFSGNAAKLDGGGMYNDGGSGGVSSPTLIAVTFTGNSATHGGGAMFDSGKAGTSSPILTAVFFNDNQALFGGAMYNMGFGQHSGIPGLSNPILSSVVFAANFAATGGAMYNAATNGGESMPKLSIVTFNDNKALEGSEGGGGAVFNTSDGAGSLCSPEFINVTFSANQTLYDGGATYNFSTNSGFTQTQLTNVTFDGNEADGTGGAIFNHGEGGTVSLKATNIILWNDVANASVSEISNSSANAEIVYSVVKNGCPSDATISCGTIYSADPTLAPLEENGGFTRTMVPGVGSSAIDTGLDSACPPTDQRGLSRPQGPHCEIGAVEVQVLPPPIAEPLSTTMPMNTSHVFTFVGIDANPGGPFKFGTSFATHGVVTISISGNTATYEPNRGYTGPDSFTYTATDANGTSLPATVSITVTGVLPVAQPSSFTTPMNVAKNVTFVGSDANAGSPFTYTFLPTPPTHGSVSVSLSGDTATYLPNKNYVGPDSFTYTVTDENGTSLPATVTITVTSILPVAEPRSIVVPHNTSKEITFGATDSNAGGPFAYTFKPVSSPSHGTLSTAVGDVITYTPTHDYAGPDTFNYTVTDVNGTSIPAIVTITVLPVGGPTPSGTTAIPTISTWGLLTLAGLIGLASVGRKQKN